MAKNKKTPEDPKLVTTNELERQLHIAKMKLIDAKSRAEVADGKTTSLEIEIAKLKGKISALTEEIDRSAAEAVGFERGISRVLELLLDRLVRH